MKLLGEGDMGGLIVNTEKGIIKQGLNFTWSNLCSLRTNALGKSMNSFFFNYLGLIADQIRVCKNSKFKTITGINFFPNIQQCVKIVKSIACNLTPKKSLPKIWSELKLKNWKNWGCQKLNARISFLSIFHDLVKWVK